MSKKATESELAAAEARTPAGVAPKDVPTPPHSRGSDPSLPVMSDEAKNWREFERWTRKAMHDLQLRIEHLEKARD